MAIDDYVPSTAQVRAEYAHDPESEYRDPVNYPRAVRAAERAFDRWLDVQNADKDSEITALEADVVVVELQRNLVANANEELTKTIDRIKEVVARGIKGELTDGEVVVKIYGLVNYNSSQAAASRTPKRTLEDL